MKSRFSLFENPEPQDLYFYGFSKQLRRSPFDQKLKRSSPRLENTPPKSNISLPSINFHVPSYQIISKVRKQKRQSSLSTPKLIDRSAIDYTMKNVMSKNKPFNHLSSKVDFFSTRNQKRLDIQKRKVFVDLGMLKPQKPPIFTGRKDSGPSPELYKLLEKYICHKQKNQLKENSLLAVGKDTSIIDQDEELQIDV